MSDHQYSELKNALEQYIAGELKDLDLKRVSAPLGIYQQRNGAFMIRVRVTGGHLAVEKLRLLAGIIERHASGYAHLTTRQDIQIHDVPVENVYQTVIDCVAGGMPFKGGGGDTFRNILVNPASGISRDSVFDVMPYALGLRQAIFAYDKAFSLPRKIKIGFVDSPALERIAAVQDLGFIATLADGKRGFTVYGGGGMGRNSAIGVKLLNFLPAENLSRCALAMTDMFYDHGDRNNRGQARIRYIVERLGKTEFVRLFNDYYQKAAAVDLPDSPFDLQNAVTRLKQAVGEQQQPDNRSEQWRQMAVSSTRFGDDIVSVRLFVPKGNLQAKHLRTLANIVELGGGEFVRLTPDQDILLPLVHRSYLSELLKYIDHEAGDIDLTLKSFKGHIVSCVGSSVCKIGILDAPAAADAVAAELDAYFETNSDLKAAMAKHILEDISISGCPNSCAAHSAAAIGLQGLKKRFHAEPEPAYQLFTGTEIRPARLSQPYGDPIRAEDVAEMVSKMVIDKYLGNKMNA